MTTDLDVIDTVVKMGLGSLVPAFFIYVTNGE